jgi:hypothetical protein
VTTSPAPGVVNVTAIVADPLRSGEGLTTITAFVPGPVAVLQVTLTALVAVSTLACILPAKAVKASNPPNARALNFSVDLFSADLTDGFAGNDESMEDLP